MSKLANKPFLIPSSAKCVHRFPVLWEGWECDSEGKVYEDNGGRFLVLTNHGTPYKAEPQELRQRIAEYRRVIDETDRALALLSEGHRGNCSGGK